MQDGFVDLSVSEGKLHAEVSKLELIRNFDRFIIFRHEAHVSTAACVLRDRAHSEPNNVVRQLKPFNCHHIIPVKSIGVSCGYCARIASTHIITSHRISSSFFILLLLFLIFQLFLLRFHRVLQCSSRYRWWNHVPFSHYIPFMFVHRGDRAILIS